MNNETQSKSSVFSRKKTRLCIAIVISILLLILIGCYQYQKHQEELAHQAYLQYHATYLILDGAEYRRDSTELDLSGKSIVEFEKLKELSLLKHLDLRRTGITYAQYADLQAALPDCTILWSVPFQDGYCDNNIQELVLTQLSENDLDDLKHFPQLRSVNAVNCTDYDALMRLAELYPALSLSYRVTIGGLDYANDTDELTVTDPDIQELREKLPLLPLVYTVNLQGTLPDNSEIVSLKEQFPEIIFVWNFDLLGVPVSSVDTFVDLSNIYMKNTDELESMLPCFYNLEKVDMINCGLKYDVLDALNLRHRETKFVWKVNVSGVWVRTDAKFFMPYKHGIKRIGNLWELRYCHDMECIDLGHFGVYTFEFVEEMPKLRFLLLLDCYVSDLSSIAACTSLEFMELAQTPLYEYWLLTNLTNLNDLNISATPYNYDSGHCVGLNDITPLYQLTWLDRLWYTRNYLDTEQCDYIKSALPDTIVTLKTGGCTTNGWRYSPNYYEHRDILSMWYMTH